jgi:hypothetical protein
MAATNIELNPQSTGLVIVDMQVEGCERHGPGVKPVIANIRRLLDRFRAVDGKLSTSNRSVPRITLNSPCLADPTGYCSEARARISSKHCIL